MLKIALAKAWAAALQTITGVRCKGAERHAIFQIKSGMHNEAHAIHTSALLLNLREVPVTHD